MFWTFIFWDLNSENPRGTTRKTDSTTHGSDPTLRKIIIRLCDRSSSWSWFRVFRARSEIQVFVNVQAMRSLIRFIWGPEVIENIPEHHSEWSEVIERAIPVNSLRNAFLDLEHWKHATKKHHFVTTRSRRWVTRSFFPENPTMRYTFCTARIFFFGIRSLDYPKIDISWLVVISTPEFLTSGGSDISRNHFVAK